MTSLFERFERSEIELFHLNQIVDIGHVWEDSSAHEREFQHASANR